MSQAQPIVFIVPGEAESPAGSTRGGDAAAPLHALLTRGRIKQSVSISAQRAAGGEIRVEAVPGEDVVVLQIAGGPELVLHPENARDLLRAQEQPAGSRGAGLRQAHTDEVRVVPQFQWSGLAEVPSARGATRGLLDGVLPSRIRVLTGLVREPAADFVAARVVERFDEQVNPGVYQLEARRLPLLKEEGRPVEQVLPAPGGKPLLVLLHGTFSTTHGTFQQLWKEHALRVQALFDRYAGQVYALEHPTLGASPIGNALLLASKLPPGARLHLLTHSRGGLVAEVMARVCASPHLSGEDLGFFAGDAHADQRRELEELARIVREKGLSVERVVRVACPARGTLLASGRLDAYLSVFRWSLELAGLPVVPALLDFLGEVAQRRADPQQVPGLAAQIPDSPLVRWLHAAPVPIPGELRVVAGDLEGDSVVSWLKTLLSDAFYWTDNDLVVQTRSMYGGAPRAAGASFLLDQGGRVSHFGYFTNRSTAEAIVDALVQDAPQGFRTIGPLSWTGESSSGVRAALRAAGDGRPLGDKPAVVLLPGLVGSHLKADGKRIWLGWRLVNGFGRLAYMPDKPDGVEPDGPVDRVYEELVGFLSQSHQVIEFAYDWRRPIEDEARRLAREVDAALAARHGSGQPVRLLAHSMGGLVARTMQLEAPDVWDRMMAHPEARLLMLGTPNGGSWAPMQVLTGDDRFGNTLAAFGALFQEHKAREVMAGFPGLLQLQAGLLDASLALDRRETWEKLARKDLEAVRRHNAWHADQRQIAAYRWGVPSQPVLDRAAALRRRLDDQRDLLSRASGKLVLVVGQAAFTPDGFEMGEEGLIYLDAPGEGDGRVTLQDAVLPGVRTWQAACDHGTLPGQRNAFEAYLELLQAGTTRLLPALPEAGALRGAAETQPKKPRVRSRPARERTSARPATSESDIFSARETLPPVHQAAVPPLSVTVINGDLTFVRQPLLLGHYVSLRLTGTERVVDGLVGGHLKHSLQTGLYPRAPGSQQIFLNTRVAPDNPLQLPRPEAVIVAGLGEEGKLRTRDLVETVRQAVLAWSQRVAERTAPTAALEIVATLMGSGGVGVSAGQAAQLIAQGVREANERLAAHGRTTAPHKAADPADPPPPRWPMVARLRLVELYLDRATEAWRALQAQAATAPGQYAVTESIEAAPGALLRPLDSSYRGADYDFITATSEEDELGNTAVSYTIDTRRARSEVRAKATQGRLLRQLVAQASNDAGSERAVGRTLFQLLVPVELEPFLGGSTEVQMELDRGTAAIPWELLDTDLGSRRQSRPWAIRSKLLRKLRTVEFRAQVNDASPEASILIVGEPHCDPKKYLRLPGARREAQAVRDRLAASNLFPDEARLRALISPDDPTQVGADASSVINALLERDWRIVHIAGHGEPPEMIGPEPKSRQDPPQRPGDPRGVVLSDGTFLGPREVASMRVVPELVFVNTCFSGARSAQDVLRAEAGGLASPHSRPGFAAAVAEELIKVGVRCVVATGWAVEDAAAAIFATTFYEALLRGARFIDAVAEARTAAHAKGGNTWAAYQCYGDPDWYLRPESADAQRPPAPVSDEFAGVASPAALELALRTLAVQSRFQKASSGMQRAKLHHLETRFGGRWGDRGAVAEAFGAACDAVGDRPAAVDWYRRALAASDSAASMKAAEQLYNLQARMAWETVEKHQKEYDRLESRLRAAEKSPAPGPAAIESLKASLQEADKQRRQAAKAAIAPIDAVLRRLGALARLQSTMERESLCGSAFKRLAMLHALCGRDDEAAKAVRKMHDRYAKALAQARRSEDSDVFYPAMNLLAASFVACGTIDAAELAVARTAALEKAAREPDFWSVAAQAEISLLDALAGGRLAEQAGAVQAAFEDLHARVSASSDWKSVYDQARFILGAWRRRGGVGEAEGAAADRLLALLAGYAYPAA